MQHTYSYKLFCSHGNSLFSSLHPLNWMTIGNDPRETVRSSATKPQGNCYAESSLPQDRHKDRNIKCENFIWDLKVCTGGKGGGQVWSWSFRTEWSSMDCIWKSHSGIRTCVAVLRTTQWGPPPQKWSGHNADQESQQKPNGAKSLVSVKVPASVNSPVLCANKHCRSRGERRAIRTITECAKEDAK